MLLSDGIGGHDSRRRWISARVRAFGGAPAATVEFTDIVMPIGRMVFHLKAFVFGAGPHAFK